MNKENIEYFKIILADKKIEIECNYRAVLSQCRDYLAKFDAPDFVIKATQEEIVAERKSNVISEKYPGIAVVQADEFIELQVIYKKIAKEMLACDTLLMHGSVISTDNWGYMFTAPSGTGKSTRTKIWMEQLPESFVVNGDKPLISVKEKCAYAYGTPWCGEEGWNTNTKVPLRAIFLLERAGEQEDSYIEEISIGKAFPVLVQQTNRPQNAETMRKTIQLLLSLESKVKFYRFRSTPTPEAIHLAYETARPK